MVSPSPTSPQGGPAIFDYPIPPLRAGLYAQLGLQPDATAEEINEGRQELSTSLKLRQKRLQRELEMVFQAVPGLREAWAEQKAFDEGLSSDAGSLRALQQKLAGLEKRASAVRADFLQLREQVADLERQLHEVNLMPIGNPADRRDYDREHPPFELIKIADCTSSPLEVRKTMLAMVRAELSDFFEQAGEAVFHPSDLTRSDFSHDYTPDKNLDGRP
jgi:hypothetical protein